MVTGSIRLRHTLIAAGLVDEYRFFTYSVVQGAGRPVLPDGVELPGLERLDVKPFRCGITLTAYAAC